MIVDRRRLPDRRFSEIFNFEVGGLHYTCSFSKFDDGSIGELFLTNTKSGSMSDANACDAAIVCSLALQHHVPLEVIRRALGRDGQGCPRTPLAAALDRIAAEVER